mgnify:CR=1 FL=1|jgi:hypothetical protein|tara:strand:+ start:852 stop:1529 length:678 start_codon:yes stop_codon:yes gene_type:complete
MTTSGTTTFNMDVDELIIEAYERCGLQVRAGYDIKTARRSLNLMFLDWASRGLNLWTIEQRTLPLTAGTYEYDLPDDTVNVLEAVIRSTSNGVQTDITINRFSRAEWIHTPVKEATQSRPAQFYVERTIVPKVYFYPNPDSSTTYTFVYYAIRRIEDAGSYTDTTDINFRFLPCLTSGLAYYIAMKRAPDRITMLKQIYEEDFLRAAQEDRDIASVYLVPDRTMA